MSPDPKGIFTRLLEAAWAFFIASLLLYLAVSLLSRIWVGVAIIAVVIVAVIVVLRLMQARRDRW